MSSHASAASRCAPASSGGTPASPCASSSSAASPSRSSRSPWPRSSSPSPPSGAGELSCAARVVERFGAARRGHPTALAILRLLARRALRALRGVRALVGVPQAVRVAVEHGRQRAQVYPVAFVREEAVQPLGRHHAIHVRADDLERLAGAPVHVAGELFPHQIEQQRLDGDVARHVPRLPQHRIQHERMAEDAVEQAVHHVAHHLARRQLEAGDHVFGVVVQLHAVARQAVQIEAGLKRHAPERPVEETKAHRQRRAGILQDVGGHWQALLVALALLGHKLFGGQAHAALLRDGALPALPPLENHVPFRYRRQVLHGLFHELQIDACARLAAVLQLQQAGRGLRPPFAHRVFQHRFYAAWVQQVPNPPTPAGPPSRPFPRTGGTFGGPCAGRCSRTPRACEAQAAWGARGAPRLPARTPPRRHASPTSRSSRSRRRCPSAPRRTDTTASGSARTAGAAESRPIRIRRWDRETPRAPAGWCASWRTRRCKCSAGARAGTARSCRPCRRTPAGLCASPSRACAPRRRQAPRTEGTRRLSPCRRHAGTEARFPGRTRGFPDRPKASAVGHGA